MSVERGEGRIESESRPRVVAVWWAPTARSASQSSAWPSGRDEQPAEDPSTEDNVTEEIPDIPTTFPARPEEGPRLTPDRLAALPVLRAPTGRPRMTGHGRAFM